MVSVRRVNEGLTSSLSPLVPSLPSVEGEWKWLYYCRLRVPAFQGKHSKSIKYDSADKKKQENSAD